MFGWLRKKLAKPAAPPPEQDPREPAYWHARGFKFANIMAVSYRWGQIDEDGTPLPEPHISRE